MTSIHGHSLARLAAMLAESSTFAGHKVRLEPRLLGGWSNVNLLAVCDGDRFVVKILGDNPACGTTALREQAELYATLARTGICPTPVEVGTLDDKQKIPFLILRYVNGHVCSSLSDMKPEMMQSLSKTLRVLNASTPNHIASYSKPSEYLALFTGRVQSIERYSDAVSHVTHTLSEEYLEVESGLGSHLDSTCEWSAKTIHADLQESNIVFTSESAVLLDLEYCCKAEPLFDLAYLFAQPVTGVVRAYPQQLVTGNKTRDGVGALIPLALASVSTWTIEWLALKDMRRLEQNLVSMRRTKAAESYAKSKILALRSARSSGNGW